MRQAVPLYYDFLVVTVAARIWMLMLWNWALPTWMHIKLTLVSGWSHTFSAGGLLHSSNWAKALVLTLSFDGLMVRL